MEKIIEVLKGRVFSVPEIILKNYKKLNITEEELILLLCVLNTNEIKYDINYFISILDWEKFKIMSIISSLQEKKLLSISIKKDEKGKSEEFIAIDLFYQKLLTIILDKKEENNHSSIYELFESELGLTLSSMQYQIIQGWLNDNFSEELIEEALKEAVYNGVNNLRYIDKILYEWNKKGIKTKEDVLKEKKKYRHNKKEDVSVFDYNWLDEKDN